MCDTCLSLHWIRHALQRASHCEPRRMCSLLGNVLLQLSTNFFRFISSFHRLPLFGQQCLPTSSSVPRTATAFLPPFFCHHFSSTVSLSQFLFRYTCVPMSIAVLKGLFRILGFHSINFKLRSVSAIIRRLSRRSPAVIQIICSTESNRR